MAALEKKILSDSKRIVIKVGSALIRGNDSSLINEIILTVAEALGINDELTVSEGPGTPGDIFGIYGDNSLLKSFLDNGVFVDNRRGISDFVRWAQDEQARDK